MSKSIVAIIGRPNVGKSTLFNRLIQRRQAIVDEQEGITRDRIYGEMEWTGHTFTLVDTGGYIPENVSIMDTAIKKQIEFAIDEADVLLLLTDGRDGVTPIDTYLADILRRSGKKYHLVINKIDNNRQEVLLHDFFSLGIDSVMTISALGGRKIGDLLDRIVDSLGVERKPFTVEEEKEIRIAIVGMPNVGKSSIANALLGHEQSIVTSIPGTTRDSIDSRLIFYGNTYTLIDTAGLRKKAKVKESIEYYSILRAERTITTAHIVLVVVDAIKGFGRQDQNIVRQVIEKGKGLIIVVNKWDLVERNTGTYLEYKQTINRLFKSLQNYPILFVSAKTKQRISKLLPECEKVHKCWTQKVSTTNLNKIIRAATQRYQPPSMKGKNIKVKYITQVGLAPPRFSLFCSFPDLITESYKNYLENQIREHIDVFGTPIKLLFKRS